MARQYTLLLGDVRLQIPWDGRPPRDLTRARKALFLRRKAQKSVSEFEDSEQYDLFETLDEKAYSHG